MPLAAGRQIFSRLCLKNHNQILSRIVRGRFSSTATTQIVSDAENTSKILIPAPEPGKIHAAVLRKFASPLSIENIEQPKVVQPNEVLIDVHYCALNGSDVLLAENIYMFEPSLPTVLGYELVGELIQVGQEAEKAGYKPGDKIIALNKERHGGFAEQCVAEIGDIWKVPQSAKLRDVVCILENYTTALIGLEKHAGIEENDLILINVGLAGAGLAAVDLATNVFRGTVIAVCATEERAALVRDKGAFAAFKFSDKKLIKQIEAAAADRSIKAIFDGVAGENFKKLLKCFTDVYNSKTAVKDILRDNNFAVVVQYLSREGRMIVAGVAANVVNPQTEAQEGSFSLTGLSLREYRRKNHKLYRQSGDDVLDFFEEGLIRPIISMVTGLYNINEAKKFVLEMKSSGKVLIDLKNKEAKMEIIKA
ncbi:quinone oxidoreductase-like protein 2 [Cephus cinctus]|uniref:Quinone oxidoreductase-like protein 2 n=1 Tax=Cephus cinctus TaxID=211228 RepID=A0AAJ7C002_CEPCN|nr:quinone oxidoreductase-like protein 2 [Cephus cinctus]